MSVNNDDWKAGFNAIIGETSLDLAPFLLHSGQPMDAWIPLRGDRGEVRLQLHFMPDSTLELAPFGEDLMSSIWNNTHSGGGIYYHWLWMPSFVAEASVLTHYCAFAL
jgi:hypothetical protein